nr:nascent polypeptide-associated complex subunit alpha, muscle-specific form-like [Microcebus murinus]
MHEPSPPAFEHPSPNGLPGSSRGGPHHSSLCSVSPPLQGLSCPLPLRSLSTTHPSPPEAILSCQLCLQNTPLSPPRPSPAAVTWSPPPPPTRPGCLDLSTWTLGAESFSVVGRLFASVPGLHLPEATCDNKNCLWTLASVPWEAEPAWWRPKLRNAAKHLPHTTLAPSAPHSRVGLRTPRSSCHCGLKASDGFCPCSAPTPISVAHGDPAGPAPTRLQRARLWPRRPHGPTCDAGACTPSALSSPGSLPIPGLSAPPGPADPPCAPELPHSDSPPCHCLDSAPHGLFSSYPVPVPLTFCVFTSVSLIRLQPRRPGALTCSLWCQGQLLGRGRPWGHRVRARTRAVGVGFSPSGHGRAGPGLAEESPAARGCCGHGEPGSAGTRSLLGLASRETGGNFPPGRKWQQARPHPSPAQARPGLNIEGGA